MAYTAYNSLTLGTIESVQNKILDLEVPIQMAKGANDINPRIQSVLDDTKNVTLRNHLDLWLKDVMPDTIAKWVNLRTTAFHRFHQRQNMDTYPLYGMFTGASNSAWFEFNGSFVGLTNGTITTKPTTYFLAAPPDSTTLLGQAVNGDRLIDVVARKLYVNRGVDATPTVIWDRQNSQDCKNYLINPDVLVQPHTYLTISRLFELGIFRNKVNMTSREWLEYGYDARKYWHDKYVSSLYGERDERGRVLVPGVLQAGLLETDFSNSGDFGDFDREMSGAEHYGIA